MIIVGVAQGEAICQPFSMKRLLLFSVFVVLFAFSLTAQKAGKPTLCVGGGWFATFSQRTQTVTNSQLLIQVDFATETTVNDVVTVIATQALTTNETWQSFEPNELMVFEQGELNYQVKATD
jgi:predicted glutamine amidotransferase